MAVNHVPRKKDGNVQPRFFHRDVLVVIGRLRVIHTRQRPHQPPGHHFFIAQTGIAWSSASPHHILRQLPNLLVERHLLQ